MPYPVSYNPDTSILTITWELGDCWYTSENTEVTLTFSDELPIISVFTADMGATQMLDGEMGIFEIVRC